ncbi:hypothetical protein ABDK00_013160 [Niabella insulamsoli]|uniref:hypothetical protein n=1 Tax=Niabella insulamsoli TaxID=3144874 RepID=UPI0031FCADB4
MKLSIRYFLLIMLMLGATLVWASRAHAAGGGWVVLVDTIPARGKPVDEKKTAPKQAEPAQKKSTPVPIKKVPKAKKQLPPKVIKPKIKVKPVKIIKPKVVGKGLGI